MASQRSPGSTSALLTDAYEITMAASYLRHGLNPRATFSLFVRNLPPTRGFLVAAGIEDCLDHLLSSRFTEDDLDFLARQFGLPAEVLGQLGALRFTGDVWAVPEGRVVFAGEPLLEVTAPLVQAQLAETYLLNRISLQTMLLTKAVRCVQAARGATLVDFSLRRAQGIDAGMQVARLCSVAGFAGTSNVAAAKAYGLPALGTMAHSYVEAFPTEQEAFHAFADEFPGRCTFLVDTYDTLRGVSAAAEVIRARGLGQSAAIRLDSGPLDRLAADSRHLLDQAGLHQVRIFVSGGLDEHRIDELVAAGAPIDAYGVGTLMGVSADAPYLDTAYKLVEIEGRPVVKLSPGKHTLPGAKQVFRQLAGTGAPHDLLCLREEPPPPGSKPLLLPFVTSGIRVRPEATARQSRGLLETDLATLPPSARRLSDPVAPAPTISLVLAALNEQAAAAHLP